jgi:toxin-antitoxin system PIN domain toxin
MIALLDASLLIALFDAAHLHHREAHHWFSANRSKGWATCPLTQNACIRIMSQPAYPGRLPVGDIARRLRQATATSDHHFWPDAISLCDEKLFHYDKILTSRHLTDLYLLGLAKAHSGRLVTFDQGIPVAAVAGTSAKHLLVL